jgi:capsular exopolysaccharide synthesis family protein
VNDLTQGLIEYTFQTRYNATNQASTWLSAQLGELRKQSEELQQKVVDLQRQSGVYSLGTVDASGREQAYSGVLDQLQQETSALTLAKQNRILKGAIMQAAQSGDAEQLSGLAGNATSSMNSSLQLIQNLRTQEATARGALDEAQVKYGPNYPKLPEMRANLEGIRASIHDEVARLAERAKSDYQIAARAEDHTAEQFTTAKQAADKLNDKAIEYVIVRQEAEQSRGLYEDLLRRLREAGVLAGLKSSNITIVDPGRPPSKPKKPNVPAYMALALAGGAFLGVGLMLGVDAIDNRISGVSTVEDIIQQSILGVTPHAETRQIGSGGKLSGWLIAKEDPQSTYSESIRAIRTSLLLTGNAREHKVILVTSSLAGEGKTTFAVNLAVILAQLGRKVLLAELDLRRGTIRQRLNLPASTGLSSMLADQIAEAPLHNLEGVPGLEILMAGVVPPNPSELLSSGINELIAGWREQYDFVVLDGAPLLPVTDSLIVHHMVDITLLLARSGFTERTQLKRSYGMVKDRSSHYVGVVLNDLGPQDESYYGYYGYRRYSYRYGGDNK